MRRFRWLIPPAIIAIFVWVGVTYLERKAQLASAAPPPPARLGDGIQGVANDWCYTQNAGDIPKVKICAKNFRQIDDPSRMELTGVQLNLYHANGLQYDLVKTASAQFDVNGKTLFSDGLVDIQLAVPVDGPRHGRMLRIHTSGVTFSSESGNARTDRAATFEFDQGNGSAVGAEYDPMTRELHLAGQVKLDWRGKNPGSPLMHVETGAAVYSERESRVDMGPWSKLVRGTLQMNGGPAIVFLENNEIRKASVQNAQGVQNDPGRKVDFAADHMALDFGESMVVRDIVGEQNTRLISTSDASRTTVTSDHMNLDFTATGNESILTTAVSSGNSMAESAPAPDLVSDAPPDTRTLHSEVIHLKMRTGGKEIETVETDGPATLDFTPNRPGQPKRNLHGDHVWISYGAANRIETFRSVNVTTRTENPGPGRGQQPRQPTLTASKEFLATFDPMTSELAHIDQKTGFTYDEGDRHARGDHATLEQQTGVMTLDGGARVWDSSGATSADHIVMNEKTSEYVADGHVASTHVPDKNGKSSAMLSNEEVLEARAQHMVSTNNNRKIHYEGNAVAWQAANRVAADKLDIDREKRILEAHGRVVSEFADQAKGDKSSGDKSGDKSGQSKPDTAKTAAPRGPQAATVFTVVRASDLVYTEETRLAYYKGGVALVRPDLAVDSKELRAFLKDASQGDSSLDKTYADGAVKIVSTVVANGAKRIRTGTSEHCEYYADEQKVILVEGQPVMIDSLKGRTAGKQLTWFANNDRLLVDGVESKPAETTLLKKKK